MISRSEMRRIRAEQETRVQGPLYKPEVGMIDYMAEYESKNCNEDNCSLGCYVWLRCEMDKEKTKEILDRFGRVLDEVVPEKIIPGDGVIWLMKFNSGVTIDKEGAAIFNEVLDQIKANREKFNI